jgi:hypothetical protein
LAIPWNIIVPVGTALLGGIFGSKSKKQPSAPSAPAQSPQAGYLPAGWKEGQDEAYSFLRGVLGGTTGTLGQQLYEGQKERLDEARTEGYDRLREDALRRGIYDSGILTSNVQELEKNYGQMLTQAARDAEVYNQQQRWQALSAILGGRPMGLDVYSRDLGQYYSDYNRAQREQDAWYDNLARILGYTYPYWSTWGK